MHRQETKAQKGRGLPQASQPVSGKTQTRLHNGNIRPIRVLEYAPRTALGTKEQDSRAGSAVLPHLWPRAGLLSQDPSLPSPEKESH